MSEFAFVVSTIAGVVSMGLAAFAIWIARSAERESRENYRLTRDLLAEIQKTSAVTETVISQSHRQLQDTVISLVAPKPATDPQEERNMEMGLALFQSMLQSNPDNTSEILRILTQFGNAEGTRGGS